MQVCKVIKGDLAGIVEPVHHVVEVFLAHGRGIELLAEGTPQRLAMQAGQGAGVTPRGVGGMGCGRGAILSLGLVEDGGEGLG